MECYYCETCDNLFVGRDWDKDARMCVYCAPPIDGEEE